MPESVNALAVQLGGLSIHLSVSENDAAPTVSVLVDRSVPVVVSTGGACGSAAAAPAAAAADQGQAATAHDEDPLPAASAAESALPPEVAALEGRLRSLGGFSARARLERAYRLGCHDGGGLEVVAEGGSFHQAFGERIPGAPNAVYAVLRPGGGGAPVITRDKGVYRRLCVEGAGLAPDSISRAFATDAEATAYAWGAGLASRVTRA